MIYRIYPSKDTFITSYQRNGVRQTGSNVGACENFSVFKRTETNGTSSLARALVKFDLSQLAAMTSSGEFPSSGLTYHLVMKDCQHDQSLPYSYDLEVAPVASDWDEGRGIDVDNFSDKGFANWDRAKQGTWWTTAGGDVQAPYAKFHLDQGDENLDVDLSSVVNSWLSGTVPNYGVMVRVSSSLESDSNDYYLKKFYGRTTNFPDKRPYIEVTYDDSVKDDRNNFVFDNSNRLYLYNRVKGALTNISGIGTGPVYLRIVDASGTIMTATGSWVSTGIYSASLTINTGSYSGSVFHDIWFSGSRAYMTGTFYSTDQFASEEASPKNYLVSVPNLKSQYARDEKVRLNLFVQPADFCPAVVTTASLDYRGVVVTKAYYQITNDRTDEVVVAFGTGSTETTRLSYDENGNYFNFYMSSLSPGNVYRVVFLFDVDGQRQIIDDDFKFRLV